MRVLSYPVHLFVEQFQSNLFGKSAENIVINFHSCFLLNSFLPHDFYIILALVFLWTGDEGFVNSERTRKVALISAIAEDVGNVLFMFATMHI